MHSKIFQISRKHKIKKENYITESRYGYGGEYEYFVGSIADYVSDLNEKIKKEVIDGLKEYMGSAIRMEKGKMILQSKEAFFQRKYDKFMEEIIKLQNITVKDFSNNEMCLPLVNQLGYECKESIDSAMYKIKEAYDDKLGFYIDDGGEYFGLVTLDYFIRNISNGDSWYFGAVIDYHF